MGGFIFQPMGEGAYVIRNMAYNKGFYQHVFFRGEEAVSHFPTNVGIHFFL